MLKRVRLSLEIGLKLRRLGPIICMFRTLGHESIGFEDQPNIDYLILTKVAVTQINNIMEIGVPVISFGFLELTAQTQHLKFRL